MAFDFARMSKMFSIEKGKSLELLKIRGFRGRLQLKHRLINPSGFVIVQVYHFLVLKQLKKVLSFSYRRVLKKVKI